MAFLNLALLVLYGVSCLPLLTRSKETWQPLQSPWSAVSGMPAIKSCLSMDFLVGVLRLAASLPNKPALIVSLKIWGCEIFFLLPASSSLGSFSYSQRAEWGTATPTMRQALAFLACFTVFLTLPYLNPWVSAVFWAESHFSFLAGHLALFFFFLMRAGSCLFTMCPSTSFFFLGSADIYLYVLNLFSNSCWIVIPLANWNETHKSQNSCNQTPQT